MFNFEQETDNENEYGVCMDLLNVAGELDLDMAAITFGMSQSMDTEDLVQLKAAIEAEIEKANQAKLKTMGRCCLGYKWRKEGAGYRCEGGTHYVSDRELNG